MSGFAENGEPARRAAAPSNRAACRIYKVCGVSPCRGRTSNGNSNWDAGTTRAPSGTDTHIESSSDMATKDLGDRGEDIAARFLEAKGYVILDRNYRYERSELDIVCFEPASDSAAAGEVVFAEVKTRSGLGFGRPEESVSARKRRHIVRAARAYLYERKLEGAPCRFDVISIVVRDDGTPEIEHFERAFWA